METFLSHSPEETERFAAQFAKKLKGGEVIALCGDLGAGKTTFVRGLFEGLGGDPQYFVTSPTFTLLQEYPTKKGTLYHLDLYRLDRYAQFVSSGLEDYLETKGITVIEWAEKFPQILEISSVQVIFSIEGENKRKILVKKSDRKGNAATAGTF